MGPHQRHLTVGLVPNSRQARVIELDLEKACQKARSTDGACRGLAGITVDYQEVAASFDQLLFNVSGAWVSS